MGAVSVLLAILEFTNVFVPIGRGMDTQSIR